MRPETRDRKDACCTRSEYGYRYYDKVSDHLMIWAIEEGDAQKNPFKEYRINESVYGKPIYISVAERKKIHETDMSDDPVLEQQKNVFVLQSLIGCRVGDYYNMTYDNLIGNAIEYIPSKTRNDRVNTIRVPLTETALEIINRYRNLERKTIMPFGRATNL